MLYSVKLLSDKQYYEENQKLMQSSNATLFDFFTYDEDNFDEDIDLDDKIKANLLDALVFEQHLANVSCGQCSVSVIAMSYYFTTFPQNSLKKEDNRNLTLLFNNMTIADLEKMSPNVSSSVLRWH